MMMVLPCLGAQEPLMSLLALLPVIAVPHSAQISSWNQGQNG